MPKKVRKTKQKSRKNSPAGKHAKPARIADRIEIRVNGEQVAISPELELAVQRARKAATNSMPEELTTTQAAEFLDVSRPFVIKLTKQGELPYRLVGKHRRIACDALLKYKEKMFHKAKAAADDMTQTAQKSGLYDTPKPRAKSK